ncbi:UvrD-helicase domain-containing protein [Lacipirellula sp.]|uniref:UvrD-helicase domain-containing protein n=1 Tax=Lacipirellula sp. TaxID=2691419 RepID=UPI003D0A0E12
MSTFSPTKSDVLIRQCLDSDTSFAVVAGAGSGKTMSLIEALRHLRKSVGPNLRRDGQRIACIAYTKRAVEVISGRLEWDDLFAISTLHSFMWSLSGRFTSCIKEALTEKVIPDQIEKKKADDNGGNSVKAVEARAKVSQLQEAIKHVASIESFDYGDSNFSDYASGKLSHDDVVRVASHMLQVNDRFRKIVGQRYPYIFVDEAQDTFEEVVMGLNSLVQKNKRPLIGYFGDPMQQIYDKRAGDFSHSDGIVTITKEENYRCARSVTALLNSFRTDVRQKPAGDNATREGSVLFCLVQAETPQGPRKRYTAEQLERTSRRFDEALARWNLGDDDTKYLFLARQMIARRMGFPQLQELFTGELASSRSQEAFEKGTHYLTLPFVSTLYPLLRSIRTNDMKSALEVLRNCSPAFDPHGINATRTVKQMKALATELIGELQSKWATSSLGDLLRWAGSVSLTKCGTRLTSHLARPTRSEPYDELRHAEDKADWLADAFFAMSTAEIEAYVEFVTENTPFSTQHGVKGEQYQNIVVVLDDVEAGWYNYSFSKVLTPGVAGTPKDGQLERTRKLAYVCFSRAKANLRVFFFTDDPAAAREELISSNLLASDQIEIVV